MSNQWGPTGDNGGGAQQDPGGGAAPGPGQHDGSEQAYTNIIQAAIGAAQNAGALPPLANSGLSAMPQAQDALGSQLQPQQQQQDHVMGTYMHEKRSSMSGSDSVSSSLGMTSPGVADRPLAISTSSPQPEPHYYGMLKDDGDDQDKPSPSPTSRSFGRRPNGEGGYALRRHPKPAAKRSESLGTIEFSSVVQEQLSNTGPMSGAASVDGGLPQVPNIDDPFGGPPAGAEIDVKRRHSTGALEYNDSDLEDYDILDLAPIADALSARSSLNTTPSPGLGGGPAASASATPQASPRRAQRRPSGDLTTKKLSKTVKKKGTKMKRRDSGNSVSSLDGAIVEIDDSGKGGAAKDKKLRSWKKPKDKPKRPLSAYNLFFQHERAIIVNTVTDEDKNVKPAETPSSDAATASGGPKKRRHRVAHGKIGFAALAQTVAARWKELPPDERSVFEARAAIEKTRYKGEMEAWNKTQKEKRLAEQRQQLKEYQEERMRNELLAQKQQLEMQQQMLMMQQQQREEAAKQQQAQRQPQQGIGNVYSQFGDNTNDPMQMLMAMQQQMGAAISTNMGNTQALNAVGRSNSNPSAGAGGSVTQAMNVQQQSQQNSFGELGGNMPTMNTGMSGTSNMPNTMPNGQQLPTQEELRAQQATKLMQIQQAQQILQMQAQAIQRQQQEQGGGSAHDTTSSNSGSGSGNSDRAPPDSPEFYANMFNTLQAQSAINSNNNSAMLQQMHQMMNNSLNSLASQQGQQLQQQQQQQSMPQSAHHGGGSSGATGTIADARTGAEHMEMSADLAQPMAITDNVFDEVATNEEMLRMLGSGLGLDQSGGVNSGADDEVGDAQVHEMLNQFDLGNLDPLGFNFGTGGSER